MALTNDQVTRTSGGFAVGNTVTSGLVSALIAGSIVATGFYADRTQNTNVVQKLGTGAYMTYADTNCTNTGGRANYTHCSIQNPLTGTAVVMRAQYDSYKAPNAPKIICMTSSNNVSTGTLLRDVQITSRAGLFYGTSASGGSLSYLGSGSVLLPPSWYIRCWADKKPDGVFSTGATLKNNRLRIWLNEQYVP